MNRLVQIGGVTYLETIVEVPSAPILPAYETDAGLWMVHCVHCRRFHIHSAGPGLRVEHCAVAGSPYRSTGYSLRYAGRWADRPRFPEEDERRHRRRKKARLGGRK